MNSISPDPGLDAQLCRRARLSRDRRFDGEFFIAVRTTGIYCRPICPVRPPAEKNVQYFRSAALAAQDGFRPCLRCRPESAPHSPAWNGSSTTVQRAVQLIRQGALNEAPLGDLAERLGVGERYLRKLFQRELGVSPQALALNQRLLFAKKLLAETALTMTEVAFAAGFGSVRRFNSAVQNQFRLAPSALRKQRRKAVTGSPIQLQLQYRPPYDWPGVVAFFERHAISGIEIATADSYQRNILLEDCPGSIKVRPIADQHALLLELEIADHSLLMPIVANVRRMFDLDANPGAIHEVLGRDTTLAPLLERFPGIRSPGSWSFYESTIRTIVGQQVSTKGARSVLGRIAQSAATDDSDITFPRAAAIAALGDEPFAMPTRRRETLRTVCRYYNNVEDTMDLATVADFKGVGPWTTDMVAMRGLGQPDIFPPKDLGLEKAWEALGGEKSSLQQHSSNWRPWGAYAASLLWRSLEL